MTLVELSVAIVIFTVATGMLLQLIASGRGLRETTRQEWLATSVAQNVLEQMRALDFHDISACYDADPFNDPGGPGTAPGAAFAVDGLEPTAADLDGLEGEIVLPVVNLGTEVAPDWQVREDQGDPLLGLPRDLNGDAIINAADHRADYTILPVLVRIRWRGRYGPRELRFFSSMTQMKP
ncbi:hypothetical protein Poly30_17550 [Planctomycetes bacterium Poly30]|uniref:Pseudopilin GspJ n=1 Tax=Saltatorellus ferox TaxID=2528018 RepID=A0A518EQ74_9BACT|nr:hypothetical protein Poly30_17550 [Planctomycetes bacterium Poly30]